MKLSKIIVESNAPNRVGEADDKAAKRVKVVADEISRTFPELNYERLKYAVASAFVDLATSNNLSEGLVDNITKLEISYTDRGRYYNTYVYRGDQRDKLDISDANDLLKYLGIEGIEIPPTYTPEVLDKIIERVRALEIEASYDDAMDVD
jgi:hypothetical protein